MGLIKASVFPAFQQLNSLWCSWLSRSAVIGSIINRKVTGSIPVEENIFFPFCFFFPPSNFCHLRMQMDIRKRL